MNRSDQSKEVRLPGGVRVDTVVIQEGGTSTPVSTSSPVAAAPPISQCFGCKLLVDKDSLTAFYRDDEFLAFSDPDSDDIIFIKPEHGTPIDVQDDNVITWFRHCCSILPKLCKDTLGWDKYEVVIDQGENIDHHFLVRLRQIL